MNLPLAASLAAALALCATAIGVTAAMADPPAPDGTRVRAVPATPDIPRTDGATVPGKDTDIVCIREEQTGTRLGARRTCMPRSVYLQRTRDAQDVLETVQKEHAGTPK